MIALKTLLFLIVVPGNVLFLIPYQIVATVDRSAQPFSAGRDVALILWLVGGVGILWCAKDFVFNGQGTPAPLDPPKELVVVGLYRYVHNPMYVGVVLVLLGHFLWFQTWWLLVYASGVLLGFHGFVIFYEEPALRQRFGEAAKRYAQTVPRWIPRLRRSS